MIAEILRPVATCLILLLVDVVISPWISVHGWSPDLLLIYVIFYSAQKGKNAGLLVGLFAGLLQDITGGASLGLLALSKSNLGFWFGFWIEKKGVNPSVWLQCVVVFVSVIVQNTWVGLITLQGSEIEFGHYIFGDVLPIAFYSAFITFLIMLFTGNNGNKPKKIGALK